MVEAQSLDSLTRLADSPPLHIRRYPPQPPPHDPHASSSFSQQLKLYIVRVPNSQDVILTTLKPLSNTVTAQDIISCLYYLRIQSLDDSADKPRSQSLQVDSWQSGPRPSEENVRSGYRERASFSAESMRSDYLRPGSSGGSSRTGSFLAASNSSFISIGSSTINAGNDFEITFIRRDRASGVQSTIGRVYSNVQSSPDDVTAMSNSYAAAMMRQEARDSKKGRRDRKRLNLEIWNPGYEKFLCNQKMRAPDTAAVNTEQATGFKDLLWPAPVPPPPPGMEDVGPPPPPKDNMTLSPKNPSVARLSRFTEVYSPDTPEVTGAQSQESGDEREDDFFKRTLNLEGEGFWKNTGKKLSAFSGHKRIKSQPDIPQHNYDVSEDTRIAMERMGINSPLPSYAAPSCPPTFNEEKNNKETKGKGYVFDPPQIGTGRCEFETNSVGRKIRLKLYPSSTVAGSPFGHSSVVKADPILLSTISFQPPENTGGADDARSPSSTHSRSSSRFKFPEKFKPKMKRDGSWTEHLEQEAGSGLKSKLGSLLVEAEGMDILDLVVVSSMGVFWKKYLEWSTDLKDGGW